MPRETTGTHLHAGLYSASAVLGIELGPLCTLGEHYTIPYPRLTKGLFKVFKSGAEEIAQRLGALSSGPATHVGWPVTPETPALGDLTPSFCYRDTLHFFFFLSGGAWYDNTLSPNTRKTKGRGSL